MQERFLHVLMRPFKWVLGLARQETLVTLVIVVTASIVVFLAVQVANRMEILRSAPQDNVQWSLAQLDVELLAVESAVNRAASGAADDLSKLRQRYDVFYSRVKTTASMPIFRENANAADMLDALSRIRARLDIMVPAIDSSDAQLLAQIAELRSMAEELRPLTRQVTLTGIKLHAAQSAENRRDFSTLLQRTAIFNSLLVLALGTVLLFLLRQINISKRRADALQISSDRNASTLVTSLDAIIITNMEGRVVEFNDAASRTFGYSRSAAMGAKLDDLIVPERHRQGPSNGFASFRASGLKSLVGSGRIETPALKSDGSEVPVEYSLGVTNSTEGQLVIAFLRDISKRIEQEGELRKARDEALEASKIKTQFLAVMSHEMRTPLNGVMAILDLLRASKLDVKQRKYVSTATTSAEILKQHVDDVLDLTRIQAGKFELFPRVFDLVELLEEIQSINVAVAEKRGNRIALNAHFPNPHFIADRKRLHQVLTNLVGNAIKFTHDGRISITVTPVDVQADVITLEFKVQDSGIGVAKDQLDKIFEDFVTLDSSYQRSVAGTGLGLPICRSIVEAMSGTIGVESEPGVGSTFWFRLPLKAAFAKPQRTAEESPLETKARKFKNLKVLVVEDNETNRFVANELLRAAGCDVVMAQDGAEGVAVAERTMFDLILMDLSMPNMNGWDAARRIRATFSSKSRNVPIYALTAHALPEEQEALLGAGMQGCVLKPLRSRELAELLHMISSHQPSMSINTPNQNGRAEDAEGVIDIHVVEELRDMLGELLFQEKLDAFVEELERNQLSLAAAIKAKDFEQLAGVAHKLAGSSAVFGAAGLRASLVTLESAARAKKLRESRKAWASTVATAAQFMANRQSLRKS